MTPTPPHSGERAEALASLYDAGWHECARMAKRDDLHCDIDSPFVEAKRQAAIDAAIAALDSGGAGEVANNFNRNEEKGDG